MGTRSSPRSLDSAPASSTTAKTSSNSSTVVPALDPPVRSWTPFVEILDVADPRFVSPDRLDTISRDGHGAVAALDFVCDPNGGDQSAASVDFLVRVDGQYWNHHDSLAPSSEAILSQLGHYVSLLQMFPHDNVLPVIGFVAGSGSERTGVVLDEKIGIPFSPSSGKRSTSMRAMLTQVSSGQPVCLDGSESLSVVERVSLLKQISFGLRHLLSIGIPMKKQNVFVSEDNHARIAPCFMKHFDRLRWKTECDVVLFILIAWQLCYEEEWVPYMTFRSFDVSLPPKVNFQKKDGMLPECVRQYFDCRCCQVGEDLPPMTEIAAFLTSPETFLREEMEKIRFIVRSHRKRLLIVFSSAGVIVTTLVSFPWMNCCSWG